MVRRRRKKKADAEASDAGASARSDPGANGRRATDGGRANGDGRRESGRGDPRDDDRGDDMQTHSEEEGPPVVRAADVSCSLLIDGDNVSPDLLRPLLERLQGEGPVPQRRVFRNWRSRMGAQEWDDASKRLAFERIDRYNTRRGKNAADIAVCVDAMDLLHAGCRRFCIASGDTDFVPLIERLRRGGAHVTIVGHKPDGGLLEEVSDLYLSARDLIGGRGDARGGARQPARQAPPSKQAQPARQAPKKAALPAKKKQAAPTRAKQASKGQSGKTAPDGPAPGQKQKLRSLLQSAYDACEAEGQADDDGWIRVDFLGKMVRAKDGSFSPQKYGLAARTSLSDAFKEFGEWQIRKEMKGKRPQYNVKQRR